MKFLVTGGEGYVGQVVCNKLVEAGHEVVSWDLGWFNRREFVVPGCQYVRGCISEVANLKGFHGVLHLAGLSCDPMADFRPTQCFGFNVGGTFHLAKIAKRDLVPRFIFASSASVYGFSPHPADERDSLTNVVSHYGVSKLLAERAIYQLASQDFHVACIRPGTLGGVSPRMRLDLLVNTMCMFAHKRGEIEISNPTILRPHLDINDMSDLYVWALSRPTPLTGTYNAAVSNHTLLEVAQAVSQQCKAKLTVRSNYDCRNYAITSSKIEKAGFEFKTSLDQTIRSVLDWLWARCNERSVLECDDYFNMRVYAKLWE